MKKDCLNKSAGSNNSNNNGNNNNSGGSGGSGGSSGTPGKWAKPKDGEPHEKEFDGVKMFWCAKCNNDKGRWTKNHLTAAHKTKEQLASERGNSGNRNSGNQPAGVVASTSSICQELHSGWFGKE